MQTDWNSKRGLQDLASSHDKMQGILFGDLKMQSSIDIKTMLCQWIVLWKNFNNGRIIQLLLINFRHEILHNPSLNAENVYREQLMTATPILKTSFLVVIMTAFRCLRNLAIKSFVLILLTKQTLMDSSWWPLLFLTSSRMVLKKIILAYLCMMF